MTVLTRTILAAVSALVCATMAVHAQDAEFFKKSDSLYYLDIYRPYPSEMISNTTPAPKGYEPFYISHIGRHGSRWNAVAYMYERPLNIFLKAHEAGELTPLGERFHDDWLKISADAKDRYGDLSPLGAQEHKGIAKRMYESYPEVFSSRGGKKSRVECRSTVVPRCILSMASFVEELSRLAPDTEITMEASKANAYYLAPYASLNSIKGTSKPLSDSVRRANMPDPERLIASLFKSGSKVAAEDIKNPKEFMFDMYMGGAILHATNHVGITTLEYLFTDEELAQLAKCSTMRRYILTGPSERFLENILDTSRPLLRNVIETADRAIAKGDEQATLRFAHDVNLIPFIALMGIREGSYVSDDYASVPANWLASRVSPMGTNVQLIFFRNKKGDILVKVLFCEREQVLDEKAGTPVNGVYYRWTDLKKYLESKL